MILLVADASSLILLTKAGVLAVLARTFTVMLPSSVEREVCGQEIQSRYGDAVEIAEMIAAGRLHVRDVEQQRPIPDGLGRGERDAMLLFFQEKADRLLTDDGRAIRVCRLLGIPYVASPRVVVDLFEMRKMTRQEARHALEKLALFGRYSPDIIAAAFERLAGSSEVNHE